MSLFVEATQLFTFRLSVINDLIANTVGAAIGFLLASVATKKFARLTVKNSDVKDCFVIFSSVAAIMFALAPIIKYVIYNAVGE